MNEEKLTGSITAKDGFTSSVTLQKSIKVEIDGVSFNWFLNNDVSRKMQVKELRVGDEVEYSIGENKGFKFLAEIRRLNIETKEHKEVTKPYVEKFRTPEQIMKNEILSALCNLYSNQKVLPSDDELIKETKYIYEHLF